ncbi:MAG: hypothetical protein EOP64_03470 [Sphingomonas sp.]|nr:MAG: hypothetical protein EOP64_03470 [Sphingomonas sp.]
MIGLNKIFLAAGLMTLVTPAPAQLPSDSLPTYLRDQRVLIGQYRYVERADGMKIDVHLNADHTALYQIRSGADDADFIKAEGVWTYDAGTVHIHNRPGPVRLEQAAPPSRDPASGLTVDVVNADGTKAEGLGVTWPGANALYAMTGGSYSWSRAELGDARRFRVLRSGDRKVLQEVPLTADGPNSFRFTYHPSDVEPFDIPAIALDERGDRLEVEVGTSYARLERVRDANSD